MKVVWLRCALGVALVTLATLMSCSHERKLVSIEIHPAATTFLTPNPGGQVIFTALGTYIHPPDTRDITDKVTWKTDIPQLIQVTGGVVSPTGVGCGIADISASFDDGGNLGTGFATVTVNDPTDSVCPGGNTAKAVVTVSLAGAGSVTSVPGGINCPATACGAQFNVGDTIVLTATPDTGHTFTSWTDCPTATSNTCSIEVTEGSTNVTATFN